jgi:UDP-N-acetyl-2-amino-2-deoxyglucuronate dehydrogenase
LEIEQLITKVNNEMRLKIGIVGCGTIASIHAQAIQESEILELISVFSRNEQRASSVGTRFNVKWQTDWNTFITDPALDAVSICTPSGNHLDYGEKAAQSGKHVIVEKPIEVTLERAQRLIRVCEENKVALAVIYQSRFIPEIIKLKRKLDEKVIGDLFVGDAQIKWFRSQEYYDSGAWRGTLALDGGGVLINQAIHTIDLLQWFMGDVESIYGTTATMTHKRLEGEDNAMAIVKYKSGAMGVIQGSTSMQPALPRSIGLHGTNGTIWLNGDDVKVLKAAEKEKDDQNTQRTASGASSPLAGFSADPHRFQFEAIANAINDGREPPVSGRESLKSLAIVLAIYKSSKLNVPVNMDEFLGDL